jgi:hypothetical protein
LSSLYTTGPGGLCFRDPAAGDAVKIGLLARGFFGIPLAG